MKRSFPELRRFDYLEAARLYESGLDTVKIGKIVGVAPNNVLRALKNSGVTIRSRSDRHSLRSRGNKRLDSGYITVCVGKHLRRKEHVLIAEKALARPLRKGEHVHHINCVKTDNRPENLLICTNSYHKYLHCKMEKHPYWKTLIEGGKR